MFWTRTNSCFAQSSCGHLFFKIDVNNLFLVIILSFSNNIFDGNDMENMKYLCAPLINTWLRITKPNYRLMIPSSAVPKLVWKIFENEGIIARNKLFTSTFKN